jgi:hypothetical protein
MVTASKTLRDKAFVVIGFSGGLRPLRQLQSTAMISSAFSRNDPRDPPF